MPFTRSHSLNSDGYASQTAWRDIQKFLPQSLHFTAEHCPVEEWWEHKGYRLHLDRWRNATAKIRLILHHGVGTNGRQMSMILGVPLHKAGFELVAIDMPGYGCTEALAGQVWSYDDWVQLSSDFIDHELEADPRPIALYGLSAGGMLTYHSAALNQKVKGIIGMTFLDQRIQQVADTTARNLFMSRIGLPFTRAANATCFARAKIPMALASKMSTLVNNEDALRIFLSDSTSAGSAASMRFLATYSQYEPAIEPEAFDLCPVLLTQPLLDRWTPLELSKLFLSSITKVPVQTVELENAGHYPLEEPGLQQMADAIIEFLNKLSV